MDYWGVGGGGGQRVCWLHSQIKSLKSYPHDIMSGETYISIPPYYRIKIQKKGKTKY